MQYKEFCGAPDDWYVLGKDTPNEPRSLRQAYKRFLKAIEIPYIRPHALRHTFCTYAIAKGIDVKTVSQLLGHSKTDVTLDIYTHVTEEQQKSTFNKLNTIF